MKTHIGNIDRIKKDLYWALNFNLYKAGCFVLYRRRDDRLFRFVKYDGKNYEFLTKFLSQGNENIYIPAEEKLKPGTIYNINGKMKFISIDTRAMGNIIAANNYLVVKGQQYNLLFSFETARWLLMHYKGVRLKTSVELNTNDDAKTPVYDEVTQLDNLPSDSMLRKYKVWFTLGFKDGQINMDAIPEDVLITENAAPDCYQEYEIFEQDGLKGVKTVDDDSRTVIPAEYSDIRIEYYRAHLKNMAGKWGIVNLKSGRTLVDFIYDEISVDMDLGIIKGYLDGEETIIFDVSLRETNEIQIFQEGDEYGLKKHEYVVLEPEYDYIKELSPNHFELFRDGKYGIFHAGQVTVSCKYELIDYCSKSNLPKPQKRFLKVCVDDLWGIVDQFTGEEVMECVYEKDDIDNDGIYNVTNRFIDECYQQKRFIRNYVIKVNIDERYLVVYMPELDIKVKIPLERLPYKVQRNISSNFSYANIITNQLAYMVNNGRIWIDYKAGQEWKREKKEKSI